MAKKKPVQLPEVGSIIAFPLSNGLYSSCWILNSKLEDGVPYVLVACSAYISATAPVAIEDAMTKVLMPDKRPSMYWINSPPLADSVHLGLVEPPASLRKTRCDYQGGFGNLHYDALTHWRWEHDRAALLAEQAESVRKNAERIRLLRQKEEEEVQSMSFEKLSKHRFFADWDDYPPKKVIAACRKIMKELTAHLMALGPSATEEQRIGAFKASVEQFNTLHEKYEELEDTGVREDIVTEYSLFEFSAKIPHLDRLIDEWRNW